MPALALSLPSAGKTGFSFSPASRADTALPKASIWHVQNPDEDPCAFIVAPPTSWGPYYTCQELQEAWDDLRASGDIR